MGRAGGSKQHSAYAGFGAQKGHRVRMKPKRLELSCDVRKGKVVKAAAWSGHIAFAAKERRLNFL